MTDGPDKDLLGALTKDRKLDRLLAELAKPDPELERLLADLAQRDTWLMGTLEGLTRRELEWYRAGGGGVASRRNSNTEREAKRH